jgi:hypothetical protein
MKQLPFDPKVDRKVQLDEEWRAVAKSYLLDSRFGEGIQSLNLKDPQMLEKAIHFVKIPSSIPMRTSLRDCARKLMKDFDRYSTSSKSDEYTEMWLRMAVVIFQTVMGRKTTHPEDFRGLVNVPHHYMIVIALLLEVLAATPGSFLRRNYLGDTDGSNEGSLGSSGHKRKHEAEEQTGGNTTHAGSRHETADEATEDVNAGLSMLGDHGDETRVDHGSGSQQVAEIPDFATHHSYQQPPAPTAVMYVPTQQQQTTRAEQAE